MATLDILYFAWVRELIGRDDERIERPPSTTSVSEVIAALAMRGGGYAEALGDVSRLRAALDQRFVGLETAIGDSRELALFPPVTGG